MISVVHGRRLYTCQWTGEVITYRFRIPTIGGEWTGAYGSPSVALSGLLSISEKNKYPPDMIHQLLDDFEASLFRNKGYEKVKFIISVAPPYTELKTWGGSLTLEEYHKTYDHDQETKIYYQYYKEVVEFDLMMKEEDEIEKGKEELDLDDSEKDKDRHHKHKRWLLLETGKDERKIKVPRGFGSSLSFLRNLSTDKDSLVLYFPNDDDVKRKVVIGDPHDFSGGPENVQGRNILGKPVYGERVKLIRKGKRERKRGKVN